MPTEPTKVRVDPRVRALREIAERLTAKQPAGEDGHSTWHQVHAHVVRHVVRLADAAEALYNLRVTRDPTQTPDAHTKRVGLAAERFNKDITATFNHINKVIGDWERDIAARIAAKTNLVPDAYAAEIRAVYRSKSPTEQMELINEFVAQNRAAELAAVIKAPASLTGMSDEHRARYEAAYVAKHAPGEVAEKEALEDAFNDALVVTNTAGALAKAYSDPDKLAEIAKAEAVAATAQQAFNKLTAA